MSHVSLRVNNGLMGIKFECLALMDSLHLRSGDKAFISQSTRTTEPQRQRTAMLPLCSSKAADSVVAPCSSSGWVYFRQPSCRLDAEEDSLAWQWCSSSENCPLSHGEATENSWHREAAGIQPRTHILHMEKGNGVFLAQICPINHEVCTLVACQEQSTHMLHKCTDLKFLPLFSTWPLTSPLVTLESLECQSPRGKKAKAVSLLMHTAGFERDQAGHKDGTLAHWALHSFMLPTH